MAMVKTLEEFIRNGRRPEYLKNGDVITEALATDIIGMSVLNGYLEGKKGFHRSSTTADIIADKRLYQTVYRDDVNMPWVYVGLCTADGTRNLSPIRAKKIYVCSKYRAKNETELQQHIQDAAEVCRMIHDEGNIPIAPHLYWPRFLNDSDPEDREYGLMVGLEALKECDGMIVAVRSKEPEEERISEGMRAEISAAVSRGIMPVTIYMDTKEER